jgi:hypothetical protein
MSKATIVFSYSDERFAFTRAQISTHATTLELSLSLEVVSADLDVIGPMCKALWKNTIFMQGHLKRLHHSAPVTLTNEKGQMPSNSTMISDLGLCSFLTMNLLRRRAVSVIGQHSAAYISELRHSRASPR